MTVIKEKDEEIRIQRCWRGRLFSSRGCEYRKTLNSSNLVPATTKWLYLRLNHLFINIRVSNQHSSSLPILWSFTGNCYIKGFMPHPSIEVINIHRRMTDSDQWRLVELLCGKESSLLSHSPQQVNYSFAGSKHLLAGPEANGDSRIVSRVAFVSQTERPAELHLVVLSHKAEGLYKTS